VQPVLSVGGKVVVNGTLNLLARSRIVLGNGLNSIENARTYDGSKITGVVGIIDANHNVIDVPSM